MQRGDIWWASLSDRTGSEPGFRRPVIIVQSNTFNETNLATVVVVAITSNVALARFPGNVRLPKKETGLPHDSAANVTQIKTLDRRFLTERIGSLPPPLFDQVQAGVRLALGFR